MRQVKETKVVDTATGEVVSTHTQDAELNNNFVQLYRSHIQDIARLATMDPLALAVWFWIVERMGRDNALVCSMLPITEHFNKSRQTISAKISALEEAGFLQIAKTGTTNIYLINAAVVWTTNASGKERAEFRGAIIISGSEQPKKLLKKPRSRKVLAS